MPIFFDNKPLVHADGTPVTLDDLLLDKLKLREFPDAFHLAETCTCPVCEAWRNDAVRPPNETAPKL